MNYTIDFNTGFVNSSDETLSLIFLFIKIVISTNKYCEFQSASDWVDHGLVNYTDNDGRVEMYLSSMEGHTIEGADFIQSPIIP